MSFSLFIYCIGMLLKVEALLFAVPALVGLIYGEAQCKVYFLCALTCLALGFLFSLKKPKKPTFFLRDGMKLVAIAWILLGLTGAIPLWVTGDIPNYLDAAFDVISGFTTTGASTLSGVDQLSRCGLFWHSFTHLIGGMGVLVFMLSVLPALGGSSIHIMRAESPGPSVDKITPKIKNTAIALYAIYLGLTFLLFIILVCCKVPVFDAILLACGTAGTGGFSVTDAGFAAYPVCVTYIVAAFMLIFSINFTLYFLILTGKWRAAIKSEEAIFFFCVVIIATTAITLNIRPLYVGKDGLFKDALFQVASLVSSSGFSTADFNTWPLFSRNLLLLLMFMGACAGSTGGGFKVSRILILVKTAAVELKNLVHPRAVIVSTLEGKPLDKTTSHQTLCYLVIYMLCFGLSMIVLSFDNLSFTGMFSGVLACINNIGPGLAEVGPASNFGSLNAASKIVLMFDMLAGRLELYPILFLLLPRSWKKNG